MRKKKVELEIGQIVYIETVNNFIENKPSDPREYKVTKINTSSIYVSSEDGYEKRFKKSDWTHKLGNGYTSYIWLSKEDYWDKINRAKYKNELVSKLTDNIRYLTVEELEQLEIYLGKI